MKTLAGGFSFINIHAQKGPKTASENIMIPTKAEGVDLAPIVIKIKPKPSWKKPAKNPKKMSFKDIKIVLDIKYPMIKAITPAINCNGTISTLGNFLTIKINVANDIGIIKAAIFPLICPIVNELPTIKIIPEIAKTIEVNVIKFIFSFKKIYPKIAKNNVWV